MGGGGTQTVEQKIPDWQKNQATNNYEFAQGIANTPYQPYQGEGVAGLNDLQKQAINQTQQYAQGGLGMDAMNQGINQATQAGNYNPQQVQFQNTTSGQINQNMNPYTQDVINTTMQGINQQKDMANQQIGGSATSAGAFGGSRQGVQEALNNKYYGQIGAQTMANLNNQNYQQAQQQSNLMNQGQYNAGLANQQAGLQGNQQKLQAGSTLGQLGQGQQQIGYGNTGALMNAGTAEQQNQQAKDNFNYQQYQDQREDPYRKLGALTGGTFTGNAGGETTSPIYKNNWAQDVGTGLLGAGMLFSDKNAKENKQDIDAENVAEKMEKLPIQSWKYKPGIGFGSDKHIGTYAQDFAKNFGGNGKAIPILDAIGVNMAATKGLAQKIKRLENRKG